MDNNNIGFIGSEGANQYSNPYQSDLYSKPSIKRQAHRIAEENKRASQQYLNQPPQPVYQQDIGPSAPFEETRPTKHSTRIKKSNKMEESRSTTAFIGSDGVTRIPISEDEEKSMKPPRRRTVCCNCCPLWLCVSITVAILAFIAIMLFIFWPKIPDVKIASVQLSNTEDPIRYEFPSNNDDGKGGVEIDMDINVNVKNDNFYNLYVHSLDTRVFLQTEGLEKTLVGKGSSKNLKFKKHATTPFTLPLTIGYYVNDILKDKALTYLLKSCTYHELINIQYEVDIGIYVIDLLYKPTYKGNVSFQCPENGLIDGIQNVLIGDIYSSINSYFNQFTGV